MKQLAEHLGGVRLGEDIESIHRARVASRRLRAALGMFCACWKRKQVKAWKKQIRQLARNLGEARDHDVLIEFLASSLAGVSDRVLVPGIACLLNHVERQRQWIQPRVLKAIDRLEASGVLKAMQAAVRAILDEAGDAEFVAGEYVRGQAGKSVRKRLKKLLDESPGLADPEQHERHHAMRIAAKRLRYTLELARPVYSGDLAGSDLANTATRSRSCRRCWARSTIAMSGSRISQSFARKECGEIQRLLRQFAAVRAFAARARLSAAGAKGPPPPGLRRVGGLLAGTERSRGLGSAGDHLDMRLDFALQDPKPIK